MIKFVFKYDTTCGQKEHNKIAVFKIPILDRSGNEWGGNYYCESCFLKIIKKRKNEL